MADVVGAAAAARGEASAPRDPGWAVLLSTLLAFVLLPGTPLLQVIAPIPQAMLLLVPIIAVCALVGWSDGGPAWLAVLWVGLAVAAERSAPSAAGFETVARGWSLLVAAIFGVLLLSGDRAARFLPRALASVAVALGIGGLAVVGTPGAARTLRQTIGIEMVNRPNVMLDTWRETSAMPEYRRFLESMTPDSSGASAVEQIDHELATTPADWAQRFFVALLALETLAALTLGWGLYHRISRTRVGPPLARLREFRFNDELVWGVIVGIVLVLLPRFTTGLTGWTTALGANLIVFFGTLYALRGLGVFAWFVRSARFGAVTLVAIAVVVGVLAMVGALAPALGLIGLGDTWENWRAKPRPSV